jgi:hypothetical protein
MSLHLRSVRRRSCVGVFVSTGACSSNSSDAFGGLSDPVLDAIAATTNNTGRITRVQICRTHRGERATAECCGDGASADKPWSPTVSNQRASICSPTGHSGSETEEGAVDDALCQLRQLLMAT